MTPYEFALSAASCYALLRGNGLPRRFAPRNDMLKSAACQHLQVRPPSGKPVTALLVCLEPPPCTRRHASVFCMSLRASAHTGVAIRFPAEKLGKLALLLANP